MPRLATTFHSKGPSFIKSATTALNACVARNDVASWLRLLLLPNACLWSSSNSNGSSSVATAVKKRLLAYEATTTVSEVAAMCPTRNSRKARRDARPISSKVSAKLDEKDVRGALRLCCSDDTIAPFTDDTAVLLASRHPPRPCDRRTFAPAPDIPGISATRSSVRTAVRTFPCGSAGRISLWRPQFLKDCIRGVESTDDSHFLNALTGVINIILSGRVPQAIRPIVYGANLIALTKKDGGVRPIAVGEVFRRVAAKCALYVIEKDVAAITYPSQLGSGVRGGIDDAIHAARAEVEQHLAKKVMLKLDFKNAFNSMRRDHLHECILKYVPMASRFLKACYEDTSCLSFGATRMLSEEGLQQGDPLAPLLFASASTTCSNLSPRPLRLRTWTT